MMTFKLSWEQPVEITVQAVALWWRSATIGSVGDLDGALEQIVGSGIYAFEGRIDAQPNRAILYIGQSGASTDPAEEVRKPLGRRVGESFQERFAHSLSGHRYLASDCWDLTLRWASVRPEFITEVESLLISAHAPAFNSQLVRGKYAPQPSQLLLLNAGAKGHLVPVVSSLYYRGDCWDAPPAP